MELKIVIISFVALAVSVSSALTQEADEGDSVVDNKGDKVLSRSINYAYRTPDYIIGCAMFDVWLEPVAKAASIRRLTMVPDIDHDLLRLTVTTEPEDAAVRVRATEPPPARSLSLPPAVRARPARKANTFQARLARRWMAALRVMHPYPEHRLCVMT